MATRTIKWVQNDLGLWKSDDGQWGIFPLPNGWHRLQVKTGPEPWDWEMVDVCATFEVAAKVAQDAARGSY